MLEAVSGQDFRIDLEGGYQVAMSYDYEGDTQVADVFITEENLIRHLIDRGENLMFSCIIREGDRKNERQDVNENASQDVTEEHGNDELNLQRSESVNDIKLDRDEEEQRKVLITITDIEVPISSENVVFSKEYMINQSLDFEGGYIDVESLLVSPSKMELRTFMKSQDELVGFNGVYGAVKVLYLDDIQVRSNDDVVFSSPSISSMGNVNGEKRYQIVPSIFYDDFDEIILSYESVYYVMEQEPLVLSEDDDFPIEYDYYGYTIVITDFVIGDDYCYIKSETEDSEVFDYQGISLKGYSGTTSTSSYYSDEDKKMNYIDTKEYYESLDKKDVYEVQIDYPNIRVDEPGEIRVLLEETEEN